MPSAEQTQNWNKEKWVDALRRFTDKPRMEYCKDQNGTVIYICAVQGHSHGARVKPPIFFERDAVEEEGTHFTHGHLFQLNINVGEWSMGRRILSLRSTKQARSFSPPNPQDSSSKQRTINGTGPGHEPKMELYKLSYRQDHDCIHYFNLRRAQDANQVFHHGSSDAIFFTTTFQQGSWTG